MRPITARPARKPQPPGQVETRSPARPGRLRRAIARTRAALSRPAPPYMRPLLMSAVLAGLLLIVGWALLSLGAGVELRALEQHRSNADTGQFEGSQIAQSFRSPRDGLSRLQIELGAQPDLGAGAEVSLIEGGGPSGRTLYKGPLSKGVFDNPYLQVDFPAVAHSAGMTYTLVLELPGKSIKSAVVTRFNSFDALSSGQMYLDGQPQAGDLAFSAYYLYTPADMVEDVTAALSSDGLLVLAWVCLLLFPGLALLLWLPNSLTAGQRVVAAPGVSALALPVFMLLARAVGVRLGTTLLWVVIGLCGLLVAARLIRARRSRGPAGKIDPAGLAFWGLLCGVLVLTIAGRLLSLRDALAGMGLDAYHHTLIGEMFIKAGGIPSNYEPYAPLASFTYHFGFHALLASVGWLAERTSAVDMLPLMPQAGQIADALPVLTLTLFGWRVLGDRWAGLAAGALAGLVSIFPSFYVNWSRYTQGLGLALLPVAWVLLLEALEWKAPPIDTSVPRARWRDVTQQSGPLMLAVIGAAGLALTHYRIAMIYAGFVALYLVWAVSRVLAERGSRAEVFRPLYRSALVGVLTIAALSPWLVNLAANFSTRFVGKSGEGSVSEGYYSLASMGIVPLLAHPSMPIIFALALGGLVWSVRRRDPLPLLPALAWLVLGVWSNPYLLPVRLPYSGYLDSTTLATGIWLPLAIPAGYTISQLGGWIGKLGDSYSRLSRRAWSAAAAIAMGLAILLGGAASEFHLASMIDSKPYVAPADLHALTWMRDNLPKSASVLANPFAFPWDPAPQAIQGSDAGLWVPLVTGGIKSSVPPIPAYNERLADPNYINNLRQVIGYEPFENAQPNWDALKQMGITHIFIGSRGGALSPSDLLQSDHTRLVFHEDAVWVFELQ